VPCSNAAKTRNPLKFAGVPQTRQQISAARGPKFTILWGYLEEILLFMAALRSRCRHYILPWFLSIFFFFPRLISEHAMCQSMVDIQSATAEIRRGKKRKKDRRRKKPQGKNIMYTSAMQGGHNQFLSCKSHRSKNSKYQNFIRKF